MSYDENPFEDSSSSAVKNPFDDTEEVTPTFTSSSSSRNSTLRTTPVPQHTITPVINANFNTSKDGMRAKEDELRRREEDLRRREKQMDAQEKSLASGGSLKRKNWPFFKPVLYQNIPEEISIEQQFLVRAGYYLWIATAILWIYNFAVILGALIVYGSGPQIASLILSVIYAVFMIPISFLIFRLLYNGARKLKSSYYLAYMCLKWFEFAAIVWQIIGVSGWGGGGFLLMIALFKDKSKTMGIIALVLTVLWIFILLCHIYLFIHARIFYSRVGGWASAKKQGASYMGQKAAENPELVMGAAKSGYAASNSIGLP